MTEPEFYGRLDPSGRYEGHPFNGLQTSPFREQRSRIDPVSGETITWLHGGWDVAPWYVLNEAGVLVRDTNRPARAPSPLRILETHRDAADASQPAGMRGLGRWVGTETVGGWRVLIAHLERIDVEPGQVVPRGLPLGITGATGNVFPPGKGVHAHVMLWEPGATNWYTWRGRRDFTDFLTMDVDPSEAWVEPAAARPQAGDPTPVFTMAQWDRLTPRIYRRLATGRGHPEIEYVTVVKTGRWRVVIDVPPADLED